jgi:hypothetical protein
VYGTPADLDPFFGFLLEDDMPHRIIGRTLFRVLADTFVRSRDGDRSWYEATLGRAEQRYVERSTLAEIIRRNTAIEDEIQGSVFLIP